MRVKYSTRIDIRRDISEIEAGFKSKFRNEIKKNAEEVVIVPCSDFGVTRLSAMYNLFAKRKGITAFNSRRVNTEASYCSFVEFADGSFVCNIYIVARESVFLLYAFNTGQPNKQTGYATKAIHSESIKFFKKMGLHFYDFGGVSAKEELRGINALKLGFGGELCIYMTGFSCNIYSKLMRLVRDDYRVMSQLMKYFFSNNIAGASLIVVRTHKVDKIKRLMRDVKLRDYHVVDCLEGLDESFLKKVHVIDLEILTKTGMNYNEHKA